MLPALPVTEALPTLLATLAAGRNAVLVAPPGAGKTTLVPLALLEEPWRGDGRILMLEPRRLATRAAATRMAFLRSQAVGGVVGFRTRLDAAVSSMTRLRVSSLSSALPRPSGACRLSARQRSAARRCAIENNQVANDALVSKLSRLRITATHTSWNTSSASPSCPESRST